MTPLFLTLTGNLLWETTLEFSHWHAGKTQRAQRSSFQVGGKGINVSRMLARLGVSTKALSFAGGATGDECRAWLEARGLPAELFQSASPTRVGLVVREPAKEETTFLGPDSPADAASLRSCADYIANRPQGSVLALCGSFPGWDLPSAEPLRVALAQNLSRGPLVADTYGPPLRWAVGQPLDLIKINALEFDGLFSEEERRVPLPERLTEALKKWPAKAWIVTDGPREVWFADASNSPQKLSPPPVVEVSATGSGDVLFACVLHARYALQASLPDAVAAALPYAAANAASPGVAEFDLNNLPGRRSFAQ